MNRPGFLCHYYDAAAGPFLNLSDYPIELAEQVLQRIRDEGVLFASRRSSDYLAVRRGLEDQVRAKFIAKGGRPVRPRPHYLTLGACGWLMDWYPHGCELRIPLEQFPPAVVSFTYGDTFPAMRYGDGKPTRGQVYTLAELDGLIAAYGLPQEVNPDGRLGPDRYIEAQLWDDEPIKEWVSGRSPSGK